MHVCIKSLYFFLKKNNFLILSHIILVTKETAFFPRVFAYNFAFGLLIILSSGQCSPAGSRMPGICHKQARRRYWCQTKFRNKCKKCPVCRCFERCLRFLFQPLRVHPGRRRSQHWNGGGEGARWRSCGLADTPGTFYMCCELLSDTRPACGRSLELCCQLGSTVPKHRFITRSVWKM